MKARSRPHRRSRRHRVSSEEQGGLATLEGELDALRSNPDHLYYEVLASFHEFQSPTNQLGTSVVWDIASQSAAYVRHQLSDKPVHSFNPDGEVPSLEPNGMWIKKGREALVERQRMMALQSRRGSFSRELKAARILDVWHGLIVGVAAQTFEARISPEADDEGVEEFREFQIPEDQRSAVRLGATFDLVSLETSDPSSPTWKLLFDEVHQSEDGSSWEAASDFATEALRTAAKSFAEGV